jgi:hypothetical protein
MLMEFDGSFAENTLPQPTFSSPQEEIMSEENAHVQSATTEPVKVLGKPWWRFSRRDDWIVVGWVIAIKIV